jgi:hypothetical protein
MDINIENNKFITTNYDKDDFYKESVDNIELLVIYIDNDNDIIQTNKKFLYLKNNSVTKNELIQLIKQNNSAPDIFKLYRYFTYNFNVDYDELNKYLENDNTEVFIKEYNKLDDIYWSDTIHIFNELNSLCFIFKERNSSKKKTLKNKKIIKKNKTRKFKIGQNI